MADGRPGRRGTNGLVLFVLGILAVLLSFLLVLTLNTMTILLSVAALALDLPAYDPLAIHGSRIPVADVRRVSDDLLAMPREQRAALPVMHPGRVDVIGAGALILRVIMDEFGMDEVVVSEHDILDGIALRLARS